MEWGNFVNKHHHSVIEQHGTESIIDTLKPFITERCKARIETVLSYRLDSVHLAIESPSNINNALTAAKPLALQQFTSSPLKMTPVAFDT